MTKISLYTAAGELAAEISLATDEPPAVLEHAGRQYVRSPVDGAYTAIA